MKTDKIIGIILLITAIVMMIIIVSFTMQLQKDAKESCLCLQNGTKKCTMQGFPWQSYLGFLFVLLLIILGIYLIREQENRKRKISRSIIKQLDKEEKKILNLIIDAQGAIFQSELVEKTSFNKVKVTRILDKLEGKNLIERRRRGMTNVVLLKS